MNKSIMALIILPSGVAHAGNCSLSIRGESYNRNGDALKDAPYQFDLESIPSSYPSLQTTNWQACFQQAINLSK